MVEHTLQGDKNSNGLDKPDMMQLAQLVEQNLVKNLHNAKLLSTICNELRSDVDGLFQQAQSAESAYYQIAAKINDLRNLNRTLQYDAEASKNVTLLAKEDATTAKRKIDDLIVEKFYLQQKLKEIMLGQINFDVKNLVTEKELGMTLCSENNSCKEKHKIISARLDFELKERRRLVEDNQKLRERKKESANEMNAIETFLKELPVTLSELKNIAKRLAPLLNTKFDSSIEPAELLKLPQPLYNLSCAAVGIQSAYPEQLTVQLVPANLLKKSSHKKKSTSPSVHDSITFENVYDAHDTAVEIKILKSSSGKVLPATLEFYFYPNLEICAVIARSEVTSPDMLSYLFPGDHGLYSPNPANGHLFDGNFIFDVAKIHPARPFLWVQYLCGLDFPPRRINLKSQNEMTTTVNFMEWAENYSAPPIRFYLSEIIKIASQRIYNYYSCNNQIKALSKLTTSVTCEDCGMETPPETTLTYWKSVSKNPLKKNETEDWIAPYSRYFVADFRNKSFRARASISVSNAYPEVPPFWQLECTSSNQKIEAHDLRQIENELNFYLPKLIIQDEKWDLLLTYQILRFEYLMDIVIDIDNSPQLTNHRLAWERNFMGRDRSKPLVYNKETSKFEQRQ